MAALVLAGVTLAVPAAGQIQLGQSQLSQSQLSQSQLSQSLLGQSRPGGAVPSTAPLAPVQTLPLPGVTAPGAGQQAQPMPPPPAQPPGPQLVPGQVLPAVPPPPGGGPPAPIVGAPAPAPVASVAQEWVPQGGADLRGIDKVMARTSSLSLRTGETVRFGPLSVTLRGCLVRPPDRAQDAAGFLEVAEGTAPPLFRGWMIVSQPQLAVVEHATHDIRLFACRP
jgi:hypothetical protein